MPSVAGPGGCARGASSSRSCSRRGPRRASRARARWPGCAPAASAVVTGTGDAEAVERAVVRARAAARRAILAATPVQHQEPRLAGRSGPRPWRGAPGSTCRCGTSAGCAAGGFGGLLAVGQGSATPPRLVAARPRTPGANGTTPHVVLVGKGITFDTGGLRSSRSRHDRHEDRHDRCRHRARRAVGAAVPLEVPVRVTGLLALAENAFGRCAYRPGDVVTHYGGTHRRGRQHRRRGPPRAGRRAGLRRRRARPRPGSSTSRR